MGGMLGLFGLQDRQSVFGAEAEEIEMRELWRLVVGRHRLWQEGGKGAGLDIKIEVPAVRRAIDDERPIDDRETLLRKALRAAQVKNGEGPDTRVG